MPNLDDVRQKSDLLSSLIRERIDVNLRKWLQEYSGRLRFHPLENLMISQKAWNHTRKIGVPGHLVFANPEILETRPQTSQHYRGMALLSQKQVGQLAKTVAKWEDGSLKRPISRESSLKVARLYNAVISSIIEGSTDWALENGYRNIIATMGIRLDGMYRNRIGRIAEDLIKARILKWVQEHSLLKSICGERAYRLKDNILMTCGSEPDIKFERNGRLIATVEIKGGKDPAGALERLGAMQKSFAETPAGCINFLVAGVVTPEMGSRLEEIGTVKVFLLDDLSNNADAWNKFMREIFHYTVRIT